jgi:EAL domain-containing protein (putative c-di-GMP-specific phosphodiesterase class I)
MSRTRTQSDKMEFLSCNFSRLTLSEEGFVQELVRIADRYMVPHNELAVEITEQDHPLDAQRFVENLKQLKAEGFRIFLDDYDTGVTSENELTGYPLDVVKIDRSLLVAAETEEGKARYRQTVVEAVKTGAKSACEGIETEEQHAFAREAGCHYGQGFLFFKPMDLNQVYEMMEKGSIL